MSALKEISFTTEAFQMMNRLRLLKVHQAAEYDDFMEEFHQVLSPIYLFEDFKFPSFELRYLHWDAYSLPSLPSNFHPMNLVELNLRCSNIKQLWEEDKVLLLFNVIFFFGLFLKFIEIYLFKIYSFSYSSLQS